jgi:hypothetical protein
MEKNLKSLEKELAETKKQLEDAYSYDLIISLERTRDYLLKKIKEKKENGVWWNPENLELNDDNDPAFESLRKIVTKKDIIELTEDSICQLQKIQDMCKKRGLLLDESFWFFGQLDDYIGVYEDEELITLGIVNPYAANFHTLMMNEGSPEFKIYHEKHRDMFIHGFSIQCGETIELRSIPKPIFEAIKKLDLKIKNNPYPNKIISLIDPLANQSEIFITNGQTKEELYKIFEKHHKNKNIHLIVYG